MAAADVVGLQTNGDKRRFRAYMASIGVRLRNDVRAFPIGVDYETYHQAARRPTVRRLRQDIKEEASGKKIIFSLSRMDYTKGIITQLQAVKQFLGKYKGSNLVYKLIVAPSREHLPEYTQLRKEIAQVVEGINKSLGTDDWQPIDYEHRTIDFEEVAAWYTLADLLLLLPDADGMNLIAKEYVATRHDNKGMAVLSTAMGSAEQLGRALLVPPGDPKAAAQALERAIKLRPAERPERWQRLRAAVRKQDIFWWADTFLDAVAASGKN
jgi:trehalose-6-phosphate synthase